LERLVGELFDGVGQPAKLYKEKIVYKRPGGNGYAPHYDGPSCALPGLASEFITVEIAIDDQTVENGCLRGVWPQSQCPGSAACLVPAVLDGNPDLDGRAGAIDAQTAASLPWQHMPSAAGSITLFNHWFPHCSDQNRSVATRRTAFLLFNSCREGDQHDAHAAHAAAAREAYRQVEADMAADVAMMLAAGKDIVTA
jgi:2-aminoethylphosphonate dioxygenase